MTLACGSSDKTVKYWDLETFQNISVTSMDTSEILHLSFYESNAELLFAASSDNVRLWNVETSKQLDCISLPPKTITDVKIAPESGDSGLLLVSAIHSNVISMYFSHLSSINFDESIDMLPTNIGASSGQIQEQKAFNYSPDELMKDESQQPSTAGGLGDDDPANISRATYIKAPKDQPVYLDMSDFDHQRPVEHSNIMDDEQEQQKKDIEIINECMERHTTFSGVMQRRSSNNKVVMNYILKQDSMKSALNALSMMKDSSITMDLLNSTFAKNKRIEMLNFEKVKQLMPHIQDLIDSKYETHMKAGLKSALNVLNAFQNQIIQIKQTSVHGGIDLAREERIGKCDEVIECYFQLSKSKSFLKAMKREGEVSEIANTLNRHLQHFLNKTKAELD